jgi:hypothetical protein
MIIAQVRFRLQAPYVISLVFCISYEYYYTGTPLEKWHWKMFLAFYMIEDTILFLLLSIAWFKIIVTTHAIIYRYSSIAGCYMQQVKDVCVRSCMPARPLVNIHRRVVSVDVRGFAKGGNRWLFLVPTPIACPTPRRWCQILARQLPLLLCLGHLCQRMQHQALRICLVTRLSSATWVCVSPRLCVARCGCS